ncbi:hypothetical protein ACFVXG_43820 [Kitasatospora sp. NPDC058162]|uniref:hypothetical protein n=1 Tax=Kitasatospora sp. NPDC058162 TaxID=3346362 RepID=UPI0036D84E3B
MAATAALVSGAALASAPAAVAAPTAGPTAPASAPQGLASPIVVTTSAFPTTVEAGTSVEFTSTLKNTADHQMDVQTEFVVATVRGSGPRQSQLKLEYQRPGDTQWHDAKAQGNDAGGFWMLDQFATELHLAAGADFTYRLRLTFTADAAPGPASAALTAVAMDPTLPGPEQRPMVASGGTPNFTVVPVGGPTTPAPVGLPDVKVEGVPASFTAGGEAKPFKAVYSNHTGKDLRIVPAIVFQGEGMLSPDMVKLEFQTQTGEWIVGSPEWHDLPGTQQYVELRSGNKDADVIALPNGETRTVNLRLAWTKDAPPAAESVFANGYSLAGPGGTERGTSSPAVAFRIVPAAVPTGTPAPTSPGTTPAATDPTTDAAVPAAQVTTGAPSPAAGPVQAAAVAPAPAVVTETRLASTGGGSSAAPMAITGATAIALGIGTLVVARRRKGAQGAGN